MKRIDQLSNAAAAGETISIADFQHLMKIIKVAAEVRERQKAYFATKNTLKLGLAKQAEAELDSLLRQEAR